MGCAGWKVRVGAQVAHGGVGVEVEVKGGGRVVYSIPTKPGIGVGVEVTHWLWLW